MGRLIFLLVYDREFSLTVAAHGLNKSNKYVKIKDFLSNKEGQEREVDNEGTAACVKK